MLYATMLRVLPAAHQHALTCPSYSASCNQSSSNVPEVSQVISACCHMHQCCVCCSAAHARHLSIPPRSVTPSLLSRSGHPSIPWRSGSPNSWASSYSGFQSDLEPCPRQPACRPLSKSSVSELSIHVSGPHYCSCVSKLQPISVTSWQ